MEFGKLLLWILCVTIALIQINKTVAAPSASSSFFLRSLNPHDPRIINGTEAFLNGTEHQVSVRKRLNDGYFFGTGHICGGSLISENVVLCAAHCFLDQVAYNGSFLADEDFIVVMGNLDRFQDNNNTLIFDIKKVVKYNDVFNVSSYDQDLVLVMLNGSVPADHPTVKPIALNGGSLANGTVCQVTGWGVTEQGYTSDLLMTLDVPIISYDICRKESAYGQLIHQGMLCAGYLEGERDSCNGDSGGPLVCKGLQGGIISWGMGCAVPKQPGVYTDVAFYKDWILTKVAEYNGTLPKFVGNITTGGNGNGTTGGGNGTTGGGNGTTGGGNGTTGGGNGTTGGGNGGRSMSTYNNTTVLVVLMVVFSFVLNKF